MPFNYFEGVSEEELLALRTSIQRRGGRGAIIETVAGGVKTVKDYSEMASGATQEVMLKRIQYALWKLVDDQDRDPNPYTNPYTGSVRRTRPYYIS